MEDSILEKKKRLNSQNSSKKFTLKKNLWERQKVKISAFLIQFFCGSHTANKRTIVHSLVLNHNYWLAEHNKIIRLRRSLPVTVHLSLVTQTPCGKSQSCRNAILLHRTLPWLQTFNNSRRWDVWNLTAATNKRFQSPTQVPRGLKPKSHNNQLHNFRLGKDFVHCIFGQAR